MSSINAIIIGAGVAGLTSAIHLSKKGIGVTIIDKHAFPRHKVCGEYVSNEVLPYLEWLGVDTGLANPVKISKISFSGVDGKLIGGTLPLGGLGISRFAFDYLLYQKAIQNGCTFVEDTVNDVVFANDLFTVELAGGMMTAGIVIGAFGKRSNIDQKMQRSFIREKSPWLAVKAHYAGTYPSDTVGLHNFNGGYCGISNVENGINICYLADYDSFKKYKNIDEYQRAIVSQNPNLRDILAQTTMTFDAPMTISQISFAKKQPVENHMLMIGDTAGLIHPLCGNGIAMAIHSAKIASELLLQYHSGEIDRNKLERDYSNQWNRHFKSRIAAGRILASLFRQRRLAALSVRFIGKFPALLQFIVSKTHGKPISAGI